MREIDASSIIHAWDFYPLSVFPKLWDWLAEEVASGELRCPSAAFTEIGFKVPECCIWLSECNCTIETETNAILGSAMAIKDLLGIQNDLYHPDGVDENDVLIVATAHALGHSLVSNENRQNALPQNMRRYKIPAVCGLNGVDVTCESFAKYFKASGKVF